MGYYCCSLWQDNLSAIDILSACNLVNYFGKTVLGGSGVGQITLYPILIRKVCQCVYLMDDTDLMHVFFGDFDKWSSNYMNCRVRLLLPFMALGILEMNA